MKLYVLRDTRTGLYGRARLFSDNFWLMKFSSLDDNPVWNCDSREHMESVLIGLSNHDRFFFREAGPNRPFIVESDREHLEVVELELPS